MTKSYRPMLFAAAILLTGASAAQADYPSDVESARMNARAGGPTNAHDAELLKRWGATTTGPRHLSKPDRQRAKYEHSRARYSR